MKKLLIIFIILGMALAAGYIYWKRQARLLEVSITRNLERFNAEVKATTGIVPIEYQKLEMAGFPFAITFILHNPVIKLPLSQWAQSGNSALNWVEEHQFTGNITLSADWKVTRYTLRFPAFRESVSYLNGSPHFSRKAAFTHPLECYISLNLAEAFSRLWQPLEMLKLAAENISLIRSAGCAMQGYTVISTEKPEMMFQSIDNFRLEASFNRASPSQEIEVNSSFLLEKFKASPASDAYFKALNNALPVMALAPASALQSPMITLQTLSQLGTQSAEFELNYTGPLSQPDWSQDIRLNIPQFTINNAWVSTHGKLQASNLPSSQKEQRLIALDATINSQFTEKFEQLLQQRLAQRLAAQPARIGMGRFMVDTAMLPPSKLPAFVKDIFPRLTKLSPLQLIVQGHAELLPSLPHSSTTLPQHIAVDAKSVQLTTSSWVTKLYGTADYSPSHLLPSVDMEIKLDKGDIAFAQLANKLIQLEKWRQIQQPPKPPILVTNEFLADLRRFIDSLAQGKRENLSAEVETLGMLDFKLQLLQFIPRINGLSLQEIMLLFNELLISHFPAEQQSPPAAYGTQPLQGYQPLPLPPG